MLAIRFDRICQLVLYIEIVPSLTQSFFRKLHLDAARTIITDALLLDLRRWAAGLYANLRFYCLARLLIWPDDEPSAMREFEAAPRNHWWPWAPRELCLRLGVGPPGVRLKAAGDQPTAQAALLHPVCRSRPMHRCAPLAAAHHRRNHPARRTSTAELRNQNPMASGMAFSGVRHRQPPGGLSSLTYLHCCIPRPMTGKTLVVSASPCAPWGSRWCAALSRSTIDPQMRPTSWLAGAAFKQLACHRVFELVGERCDVAPLLRTHCLAYWLGACYFLAPNPQ